MKTAWDVPTRQIVAVALGVFLVLLVYVALPVLPPLVVAALMALILAPVISFFHNRLRIPRVLAILLAYLLLVVVLLLLLLILLPALANSLFDLGSNLGTDLNAIREWLTSTLEGLRTVEVLGQSLDLSATVDPILEALSSVSPGAFAPSQEDISALLLGAFQVTKSAFGALISVGFSLFMTFVYAIYMSADAGRMRQGLVKLLPPGHEPELTILASRIREVWEAYLRGQLTVGVIIWIITWLLGWLLGLPGAFALGFIAGVLEVIPHFGPIIATVPMALVALMRGSERFEVNNLVFMLIVIVMYILVQQLEDHVITPKVLGDAVELPPLLVMISLAVGFEVGGVLGAIIAVPSFATGREVFLYLYAKVLGRDPYPSPGLSDDDRGHELTDC